MAQPKFIKNMILDEVPVEDIDGIGIMYLCDFISEYAIVFESYSRFKVIGTYNTAAKASFAFDKYAKIMGIKDDK